MAMTGSFPFMGLGGGGAPLFPLPAMPVHPFDPRPHCKYGAACYRKVYF